MDSLNNTRAWQTKALWIAIALLGAVSFGIVALNRGEAVNAAWLVVAAVCVYFIAYRFYGLFVANRALGVDVQMFTTVNVPK
jgi:Carbon starvation protein CstA